MANTKLPCLAIESFDSSHTRWFIDGKSCQKKYDELVADVSYSRCTITRFELTVNDLESPDRITEIVDLAMRESEYVVLQRRHGTDKIFVVDPQPRYQTELWKRIHDETRTLDLLFKRHLIEQAEPHQKLYSAMMEKYQGNPIGIEFKSDMRSAWGFVCPSIQTETSQHQWRVQHFDEHGFTGHECYRNLENAVEALLHSHQKEDVGSLDRVSACPQWAIGLRIQEVRDLLNQGQIGYAEFTARCNEICNVGKEEHCCQAV